LKPAGFFKNDKMFISFRGWLSLFSVRILPSKQRNGAMGIVEQQVRMKEYPAVQAVAEAAIERSMAGLQHLWKLSLDAEKVGDFTQALQIHDHILKEAGRSYLAYLRAGWLHYRAGGYLQALEFYGKAARRSPGSVAPLFGAMGCHVALGEAEEAARLVKAVIDLEGLENSPVVQEYTPSLPQHFQELTPFADLEALQLASVKTAFVNVA
jgi:tetratricopeptide (TPR) repeat protein